MKTKLPITERINGLKDIISIVKPNADELKLINYKGKAKRILGAQSMLLGEMIAEAYNEGTKLNWKNYDQKKWFGWFDHSNPGSGFDDSLYFHWRTISFVSARLHFKEEALFWDAVKKFPKIYKTLMTK